jgi:hypothetical protein
VVLSFKDHRLGVPCIEQPQDITFGDPPPRVDRRRICQRIPREQKQRNLAMKLIDDQIEFPLTAHPSPLVDEGRVFSVCMIFCLCRGKALIVV